MLKQRACGLALGQCSGVTQPVMTQLAALRATTFGLRPAALAAWLLALQLGCRSATPLSAVPAAVVATDAATTGADAQSPPPSFGAASAALPTPPDVETLHTQLEALLLAEGHAAPTTEGLADQAGRLFELVSLLTTQERAQLGSARARRMAKLLQVALVSDDPLLRSVALSSIGVLAGTSDLARAQLAEAGLSHQLRTLYPELTTERQQGQALFALGALYPEHERAHPTPTPASLAAAQDRALLQQGLLSPSRFVQRQAVLGVTLAREELLDKPLLAALGRHLGQPAPVTEVAQLKVPATLTPALAAELLPLLPAYIDLLLSLAPPVAAGSPPAPSAALERAQALASAVVKVSPRSGTARFLLGQVQARRADAQAASTLRAALALGNLPQVFIDSLGAQAQALTTPVDTAQARAYVRAQLAQRPPAGNPVDQAVVVQAAQLLDGSVQVRSVVPSQLAAQAQAVQAKSGADSDAGRALGQTLFTDYPFASEAAYDTCLRSFLHGDNRDLLPRLGLQATGTPAQVVGVVLALDPAAPAKERSRYGVTCALCHTQVDAAGRPWLGLPTRTYDQGLLLAACVDQPVHYKSGNRNLDELLAYGAGRNDSTSDGVHNPTEIPSLLGLRVPGPVRWNGDTPTLPVQIDRNLSPQSAPPAVVALVAAYLRALPLPPTAPEHRPQVARGQQVFAGQCQRCHAPPAFTSGRVVSVQELQTDATRVSAVLPNSTEGFKIPSLLQISRTAPYLHDGSVPSLPALLSPQRDGGHRFGQQLSAPDRLALVAYLQTL